MSLRLPDVVLGGVANADALQTKVKAFNLENDLSVLKGMGAGGSRPAATPSGTTATTGTPPVSPPRTSDFVQPHL